MSTQRRTREKSSGTTLESRDELQMPGRIVLGTDGDGAVHHMSRQVDRIVVVRADGTTEEVIDIDGRTLAGYIAFVDDRRGWATLRYKETFGDILREAL
jgi:hypothetical protein